MQNEKHIQNEDKRIDEWEKRNWDMWAGKRMKAAVMAAIFLAETIAGPGATVERIEAAEFTQGSVWIEQSAVWTDEDAFRAELCLRVNGLQGLCQPTQKEDEPEESNEAIPEAELEALELVEEEAEHIETTDPMQVADSMEIISLLENVDAGVADCGQDALLENENVEKEQEDVGILQAEAQQESAERQYFLTAYISEYFEPVDLEAPLWASVQTENISIQDQNGENTQITKITCLVEVSESTGDSFELTFPIMLREKYQKNALQQSYLLTQEEPLQKDRQGAGCFFWQKTDEGESVMAAGEPSQLQVKAANAAMMMELQADTRQARAGEVVNYTLKIANTGDWDLENIEISSLFSDKDVKAVWETEQGSQVNGTKTLLQKLSVGESKTLRMTLQLAQDQHGELIHTVNAITKHPGKEESIGGQVSCSVQVQALQASFEVEKTADRTEAFPGDTITYQICIRNTGEKTLHSVLSTERFLNANIQAQFTAKEGVTLNSTKTQALIPEIAPGEAFALYATVTIPQYFASQELVNEVTVTSDETGEETIRSQSKLNVCALTPTAGISQTPTPAYQTYTSEAKTGTAYAVASKPQTGDQAQIGLFAVMGIFAAMSAVQAFCYQKSRKKGENQD